MRTGSFVYPRALGCAIRARSAPVRGEL